MNILLKQRFQISTIALLKNYCLIGERPPLIKNEDLSIDNIMDELFVFSGVRFRLASKEHKNKVYFHTDNPNGEHLDFNTCKLNGANAFLTTDTKKLKKYYGNPFAQITISTYERKISLNGKNLTLKYYKHSKHREVNWKFFSKTSSSKSVTINLETGNITTIEYTHGKGGNKTIRKNCFADVFRILSTILDFPTKNDGLYSYASPFNPLPNNVWGKAKKSELRKQIDNEFNLDQIYSTLFQVLGVNASDIFGVTRKTLLYDALIKFFVKTKNIKVPNNYFNLLINWYPTMKFLKKNDNKLIAAILDRFNLKSKYLIKLIHEKPNINVYFLVRMCWFFGRDYSKYIPKINPSLFCDDNVLLESNSPFIDATEKMSLLNHANKEWKSKEIASDIEKSRAVKYFNCSDNMYVKKVVLISDFDDHLKMLEQIKKFYPDRVIKATTIDGFKDEHLELTKFSLMIKRGESIEYVFNENLIKEIEKEINVEIFDSNFKMKEYKFYPVILKREEEYIEEGTHMHHCVASYVDKETSLIVSLRLNSSHGSERVTCEYNTYSASCIQTRYFCNGQPPVYFNEAIIELQKRIEKCKRILKSIDKKVNTLIINGISVSDLNENVFDPFINDYRFVPLPF